jgi:hypothetical protein
MVRRRGGSPVRRQFVQIAVLALVIGAATWWFGWWTVPLVGVAWGAARRGEGYPVLTAGVAASLAWVVLLAVTASHGRVGTLARTLGGILGIPGWAVLAVTLLFPAVLAAAAAALAGALQHRLPSRL